MAQNETADKYLVLLLEDSSSDQFFIERQLKDIATVQTVSTREDFEKALHTDSFDVILLDFAVPQIPGEAALPLAKSIAPSTPIIIVSGSVDENGAIAAVENGASDFVSKDELRWLPLAVKRAVIGARERSKALRAQRSENIGALATGIAHDLNNVLFHIVMAHEIIERTCSPENRRIIRAARKTVDRAVFLVRHLTTFVRGRDSISMTSLDVLPLVNDVVEFVRATTPASVQITVQKPESLPAIVASQVQIQQVLQNLMLNARDELTDGGQITVRVDKVEVKDLPVSTAPTPITGEFVRISVQDNNGGIQPHILPNIFKSFFSTKVDGSGVGLSTVASIMQTHRGYIDVSTQLGEGSTFTVLFPIVTVKVAEPPLPELQQGNGEMILVADDKLVILETLRMTLEANGYFMHGASTGAEALAVYRLREKDISVVLTDLEMPGGDGKALIGLLREIDPKVRVIAMTGAASDPELKVRLNADYLMMKPFTSQALLDTLHEVCAKP